MAKAKKKQKAAKQPAKKSKAKSAAKAKPATKAKPAKAKPQKLVKKQPAKKKSVKQQKQPAPPPPAIVQVAPTAVPVPVPIPAPTAAAPKAAPAPKAKKAAKVAKPPTVEQQRRDLLEQKNVDELKLMLKTNEQITTGSKGELVKRILDGIEHGALPRCPQCGLGRLKVSKWSSGGFYCPGGYDDDEYMACDFAAAEIERPAWKLETPGGLV